MKKIITRLIGSYLNLLALVAPRMAGKKGFYLFCTPQSQPVKDHQRNYLDNSEKFSFTSAEGVRIQGYRWGSGPRKILFLHGWQSHSFRWKNYLESFSKEEYTLYAFDAPGHGLSGKGYLNLPIYSRVIELFLKQQDSLYAVVSHSLGSMAILYTFYRFPSSIKINKLVLTGIPGEVKEFISYFKAVLGLASRTMQAIRNAFQEILNQQPEFYSAATFAPAVKVPTLIIHDEFDAETPYHHAVKLHGIIPHSQMITTSGLGHNLRSPVVIKHVVDFVKASDPDKENSNEKVTSPMESLR